MSDEGAEFLELSEDTLAVNELFGEDAVVLRELVETECPDLALHVGVNETILGFVPTFFYEPDHPDLPDAPDRASIVASEIRRYAKAMDAAMKKFDSQEE